jgi:DNA adenine methylase
MSNSTETKNNDQISLFPKTRFMGSKYKLLNAISDIVDELEYNSVIDLFSGTSAVGYLFKTKGKKVISNDYMYMASVFSKALIGNNRTLLLERDIKKLLKSNKKSKGFVEKTFKDLYFLDEENRFIDNILSNVEVLKNPEKEALAKAALIRACIKKRPRGIFTYTGHRYDDGRKDLRMSLEQQFMLAVDVLNGAIFDNKKKNISLQGDSVKLKKKADLVYIDPPYFSKLSDNEYVRRYHFVEGIARNWEGVEIQEHTKTKKFKSYPTKFSTLNGTIEAFDEIFSNHKNSILLVSYSSNSLPNAEEMVLLLQRYKDDVKVFEIDYKYSFGNQSKKVGDNKNTVKEYLFLAK